MPSFTPPQHKTDILPKITIITPSYNQGQYIEQTIQSILSQNYPNLEYIIIDGGSIDNSLKIIKKYESQITYWVSEKDGGQSDALNKGLARASGTIFNWINSDDCLAPHALWTVAQHFIENPDIDLLCGFYQAFNEKGVVDKGRMDFYLSLEKTLLWGNMSQPSLFYRLEKVKILMVHPEIVGRGVNPSFHYCMDLDLYYRYATQFGLSHIKSIDSVLALFRLQANQKSSTHPESFLLERTSLNVSLLKSIGYEADKALVRLCPFQYNYNWHIDKIEKNVLAAYILDWTLDRLYYKFSLSIILKFYFKSLFLKPFGRRWRFYLLPFLIMKRLIIKPAFMKKYY